MQNKNKVSYPDYANAFKVLDGVGSYTAEVDGFVQAYGYSREATNKPIIHLTINGMHVLSTHGPSETYVGNRSPLYPVKIGDVIAITACSWSEINEVNFFPLRY